MTNLTQPIVYNDLLILTIMTDKLLNWLWNYLINKPAFNLQCFDTVGWVAGRASTLHKTEWWGAGVVICLERGAVLHMAQLMPLPLTVSCFSEIQTGFTFLVPAHLGSPGQRAVKRVCVCSTSYVSCQCDTVRICGWAPAPAIDRYFLPVGTQHQTHRIGVRTPNDETGGQTDRRSTVS